VCLFATCRLFARWAEGSAIKHHAALQRKCVESGLRGAVTCGDKAKSRGGLFRGERRRNGSHMFNEAARTRARLFSSGLKLNAFATLALKYTWAGAPSATP
jgi:hypothetical protein